MIEIYSTKICPYCDLAKAVFDERKLKYTEYLVDSDSNKRTEMLERSQRRTVPQIFIHGHHVGGFDDLKAVIEAGKLDSLLKVEKA